MATFGYRTASDLTGLVGRWVHFSSPGLIGINDSPGMPSLGALVRLYEFNGVQWGQVDSGVDLHKVQAAVAYAEGDLLTNDAAGASVVAAGMDVVHGVALEDSTGPGLYKVFAFSGNTLAGLFMEIRERFHFSTWIVTPGGPITWNLANDGAEIHTGASDPIGYPLQNGPFGPNNMGITAIVGKNNFDTDSVLRLFANGVSTGILVTIPAGATGRFNVFGPQMVAPDGWLGLALETTASAGLEIQFGATVLAVVS